jgi:hypothetical protein
MSEQLIALQRLVDREEIRDVVLRFARAIDRLDIDLGRTVFWEDGGFEDGIVEGRAEDFMPALLGDTVRAMFAATQHFISNIRVDFESSSLAFSESYFLAFHLLNPGREALDAMLGAARMQELGSDYGRAYELMVGGRYFDRFERRGDIWRIKKRRFVCDWTTSQAASGIGSGGFARLWKLWGSRDHQDPSYLKR